MVVFYNYLSMYVCIVIICILNMQFDFFENSIKAAPFTDIFSVTTLLFLLYIPIS